MKHSIKRILSFLAAVLLGSTMLAYGAEIENTDKKEENKTRAVEVDHLTNLQVYRIRHQNSGKYLTLSSDKNNVIVANETWEGDKSQLWQFYQVNTSTYTYGKFRSYAYDGQYYLDVNGSYSTTDSQNTYLRDGTNVTVYNNDAIDYGSSQWVLGTSGLLAKMSRYDGSRVFGSSYWKYLVPDPNGSGNVIQHGLSGLPAYEEVWVFELVYSEGDYHSPFPTGKYNMSRGFSSTHAGLDLVPNGTKTNVYACADGQLKYYYATIGGKNDIFAGYGIYAVLTINSTQERVVYAHLSELAFGKTVENSNRGSYRDKCDAVQYTVTETAIPVSKGMLIGKTGNTGNSSAEHLHLELWNPYVQNQSYISLSPYKLITNMNIS
ncbi:MAG: hypothetical protein J6K88_03440 [Oscillospiraceae bacterium]|nr:hypothetical protein [Oscillospiraceae bacterium]